MKRGQAGTVPALAHRQHPDARRIAAGRRYRRGQDAGGEVDRLVGEVERPPVHGEPSQRAPRSQEGR